MLDQVFNTIGGNVINTLTEKTGLNLDQAKAMLPIAQETTQTGLMDEVKSGNISGILSMLNSQGTGLEQNSVFAKLKGMLMQALLTKMGLPESVASLAAGTGMDSIVTNMSSFLTGNKPVEKEDLMSKLDIGGIAGGMLKDKLGDLAGGLGGKLFGK